MRRPARWRGRAILAVAGSLVLGGCTVLVRSHEATVLEAPSQGQGAAPDWWNVHVELSSGDIVGSEDVLLGFHVRALMCEDGSGMAPRDLEPGTVVRLVREGDGVDTSDPPAIIAREIRAECSG